MAKSVNLRRFWRAAWLGAIQELANLDLQKATWLNPRKANLHYSFAGFVRAYFDERLLDRAHGGYPARIAEGLLSQAEADRMAEFHALLERYVASSGDADDAAVLADPAWLEVVAAAGAARQALRKLLTDSDEIERLLVPSPQASAAAR